METVFVSYSHKNEMWKDRVTTYLGVLENQGTLKLWDDRKIGTGADWFPEIERELNSAKVVIMVITAEFLNSCFILNEEVPRILERRKDEGFLVVPLIAEPCPWQPVKWLSSMQLFPKDGIPLSTLPKPKRDTELTNLANMINEYLAGDTKTGTTPPAQDNISIYRLPTTTGRLFGREKELSLLDDARADGNTHMVTLTAWGGVGKTALVNEWLNRLQRQNYGGAQRVYAWSFYSQGAEEGKQASADEFLHESLAWFGDTDPKAGANVEKGRRLAGLVRKQKTLLFLDGLEPLQYPPGEVHGFDGKLKDAGMAAFLKELAACPGDGGGCGLCLVTTRERVTDLAHKTGHAVKEVMLEHLSDEAGADLLKSLGVTTGTDAEVTAAVKEYGGHALALTLLGNYIKRVHHGDIRKRDKIPRLTKERIKGGHARRVMEAYERWFRKDKSEIRSTKSETNTNDQNTNDQNKKLQTDESKQTVLDFEHSDFEFVSDFEFRASNLSPELNILYILGLFDRPVEPGAIESLKAAPAIPGVTDHLVELSEEDWEEALSSLRTARLLGEENLQKPGTLDCHPLVREHFGERLRAQNPGGWKAAHERLYLYFKALPKKEYPDTLAEMEPLFAAVAHGCKAGRHGDALGEVYSPKIQRGGETNYCCKHLGAFGADLAAVSHFFDVPWGIPAAGLSERRKALVLSWAAFRLRAVGRLREAGRPMKAGLEMNVKEENWKHAAMNASNLSELMLTLGDVQAAVDYGRRSVTHADRSKDGFMMEVTRTILADALHQSGQWDEAEKWFREAEAMQKKHRPHEPFLYSLRGYRFCDLLLIQGATNEVMERAEKTLEWALQQGTLLLDIALNNLTLGRAWMIRATQENSGDLSRALAFLETAVTGLRKASRNDYLPRALIARAECYRRMGAFSKARENLDEAEEIAETGDMKLFLCDVHLERAKLCRHEGNETNANQHLQTAEKLIEETGYGRRKKD